MGKGFKYIGRPNPDKNSTRIVLISLWLLSCSMSGAETDSEKKLLGDKSDGSRAIPVHLMDLYDERGHKVWPDDELAMPFSVQNSCGQACHNYQKISKGWHFNAFDANVATGRVGQPWIFVDIESCTQVPLSYRRWKGAFRPEEFGISAWDFVQYFGRHMPGGVGEIESDEPQEILRSFVTGDLEINCLSCHSADAAYDQAEYAQQIYHQNYRWAATAASGIASVSGSARNLPDSYDYLMPAALDDPTLRPPEVTYNKGAFDHKGRVFFNITREVPNQRCYFCHSNIDAGGPGSEKWSCEQDVHLAAGLLCVDCHRNGLEHDIIRGYEGESSISKNKLADAVSCSGCHLPEDAGEDLTSGRLGAPTPEHLGIPLVHFDKLTCTACHSGPWPDSQTLRTKTSRAHKLGLYSTDDIEQILPVVVYPVFTKGYDGKIGPGKLIWPAFWAALTGQAVEPISLDIVRPIVKRIIRGERQETSNAWPDLSIEKIRQVLKEIASEEVLSGEPAYVSGGKLYRLDNKGQIISQENESANFYIWPIAHNVRPGAQSLGVRACEDCHTVDSPFFFGKVEVEGPVVEKNSQFVNMINFQGLSPFYEKAFAFSFVFRDWLKIVSLGSCVVIAGILLLYALRALACIASALVQKKTD
ncbi:MAG: hypothetical protein JXB29_04530 [Sedimentisphaerales bacterium]|nr:hypothetical protein [Sedimentisphaerales bacterium]